MAASTFEVVDVSSWPVASHEPRGDDPKEWLRQPTTPEVRWLFKPVTQAVWGQQGEDWAEKIATEIAVLLSVPCAAVELAERISERGTISRDLAPSGTYELFPGAVLLSGIVPNYRPGTSNVKGRPGHSLDNIRQALQACGPPPACSLPENFGAFDVFTGYLMLDALVANRDRHDQNWAVLRPRDPDERDVLCGSFDHGSALGFGETDVRRQRLIDEGRLSGWAEKGTAYRFEHTGKAPTLVALARSAFTMAAPDVRDYWLEQLQRVTDDAMATIVDQVPNLSDPTRTFIVEVLRINRGRVLDEC